MNPRKFIDVDPRTLRLPTSRREGADRMKLQRQEARYGSSLVGMPPIELLESTDGEYVVFDGVTRATRAAKRSPGSLIRAEVTGFFRKAAASFPTVGDKIP